MTPVSSPAPASITEVVLSKTSLAGICLIAFACGIVTTVMVDRARPRASEHDVAARETEPAAPPAAPASEPVSGTPVAAPAIAPAPVVQVQAAPAPTATTAGEPVVVQMPNLAEMSRARTTVALRSSPAASRAPARQRPSAAVAPAKAATAPAKAATAPAKAATASAKAATAAPAKKSKTPTSATPASRWIDPFSE